MGCTPFHHSTPEGKQISGVYCAGRTRRAKCAFCFQLCVPRLCDWRLDGPCDKCTGTGRRGRGECSACTGSGILTCNKRMCAKCAAHVEGQNVDYCPEHRVAAGFKLKREPCEWTLADFGAKCIHKGCEEVVAPYERCLWFTIRNRPMCLECGAAYLEISE